MSDTNKKYELTNEIVTFDGHTLYRIKALKDFGNVKAGDLGGFIESYANLSQNGYCWVADEARVYGDAWVYGDAQVCDNARIYGDARIAGCIVISGDSYVGENSFVE